MNNQSSKHALPAFFLIASIIGAWLIWDAFTHPLVTYSLWADYWEHSAALTEWMRDILNPGNPHLSGEDSSARYIPNFLVLAALGNLFGWSAIELLSLSSIINYFLLVAGIYLFSKAYFQDPWAPFITFLVLFFVWGVPWIWSNLYQLRSFFMVSSYPSTFVFGLSLISFWISLRFLRLQTRKIKGFLAISFLSALMFISHPLTAVFGIAGCCLLALIERDASPILRLQVIIFLLIGLFLASYWPYFSVWDVVLATSDIADDRTWQSFQGFSAMIERAQSGDWWHVFYDPQQLVVALGPALFGLPICLWLLIKRKESFIILGAIFMILPYFINIFYQIALAHRFLLYAVFFLHLSIVWAILQQKNIWFELRLKRNFLSTDFLGCLVALCFLIVSFSTTVSLLLYDFKGQHLNQNLVWVDKRQFLPPDATVVDVYTELSTTLSESSIVIGNSKLTWILPTFKGKVVSLPENHENSLVPDEKDRIKAEMTFLDPLTNSSDRESIILQYNVSHAFINKNNSAPELIEWLKNNAKKVAAIDRYEMYSFAVE
ncbi:MAG: hypothetical protein VYA80_02090 [Pseudomonadota bacterium]|nr:hypothetical protein [Pseudomonadota bacterium]